jgi:hypothetical protein
MVKTEPYNHDISGDPLGTFATDDEIAIADQLRHQLEERYLEGTPALSNFRRLDTLSGSA